MMMVVMVREFSESFLRAKRCAKCYTYINPFDLLNSPMKWELLSALLYR